MPWTCEALGLHCPEDMFWHGLVATSATVTGLVALGVGIMGVPGQTTALATGSTTNTLAATCHMVALATGSSTNAVAT